VFSIANAKTKTQLKLICQTFDFMYESQQNVTNLRMLLSRLKVTPILTVWHELFPIYKHGCRKRDRNSKISAIKAVFLVRVAKHNFHHFGSPSKTGKIHLWPAGEDPSDPHAHKHAKL